MAFIMDLRTTCKPGGKRTSILTLSEVLVFVFLQHKIGLQNFTLVIWHKVYNVSCASSYFKYTESAYKSNSYELYIQVFSDHAIVLSEEYDEI